MPTPQSSEDDHEPAVAYLHFGTSGPHTVALAVVMPGPSARPDAFLEELIVRRELAVNFVRYNSPMTVSQREPWRCVRSPHTGRIRVPSLHAAQLEHAETHDPLWKRRNGRCAHRLDARLRENVTGRRSPRVERVP